jgi:L-lysine exporter family protein LysE/ArgO
MVSSALSLGFAITASLIVAIGAQNAFVLRQGLRREHVGAIVAFCIAADAALIVAGVAGLGASLGSSPSILKATALAGGAFLAWYAARSFARVARPSALRVSEAAGAAPLRATLGQLSAFTFLNPHVYIDTVLLIGSVGAQQPAGQRWWFSLGAISASALWFTTIGFGARFLKPLFARPISWQILDATIGLTMLWMSYLLLRPLY